MLQMPGAPQPPAQAGAGSAVSAAYLANKSMRNADANVCSQAVSKRMCKMITSRYVNLIISKLSNVAEKSKRSIYCIPDPCRFMRFRMHEGEKRSTRFQNYEIHPFRSRRAMTTVFFLSSVRKDVACGFVCHP